MLQKFVLTRSTKNATWKRSGAAELCSPFYIVEEWAFSSSVRQLTWYIICRCTVLFGIIKGTEEGAVEFCST